MFGRWVQEQLALMVAVNRLHIRAKRVPLLYSSGVRYRSEVPDESYVCALTCYEQGWGDCAHLAAWRCAELREMGDQATVRVTWRKRRFFHVQVRRGNGSIEDPSERLGMGKES